MLEQEDPPPKKAAREPEDEAELSQEEIDKKDRINAILKICPSADPNEAENMEVDPKPYQEMLEKNYDKLKKKNRATIVEDDFVTPGDFRNPGGRRRDASDSGSSQNMPMKTDAKDPSPTQVKPRYSDDKIPTQSNIKISPRKKGDRESSAAKPPLSPAAAQDNMTPTQKKKPRMSMSTEKAKGILKGDQHTPSRTRNKSNNGSLTRSDHKDAPMSNRSSRNSRRGAQSKQGSRGLVS